MSVNLQKVELWMGGRRVIGSTSEGKQGTYLVSRKDLGKAKEMGKEKDNYY